MEQEGLLGHVGDLPAQGDLGHFRDVLSVDADASFLDVSEAQEQFGQRGLSGTGPADKADALSGGNGHREVFEDVLDGAGLLRVDFAVFSDAVRVLEPKVIEADLTVGDLEVHRVRNVVDEAGLIEVLGHFGGVAEAAVDDRHGLVDHVEPEGQVVGVGEDQDQCARADAVPGIAARDEDGLDDHDDDDDAGGHGGAQKRRMHAAGVRGADFLVGRREQVFLIGFAAGGLDREDVRDTVGQFAGEAVLRAGGHRVAGQRAAEQEPDHDDVHDEDGRQDDDVERDQRCQHDDGQDRRRDEGHQRVVEQLDERGVGVRELGRLGHQRAAEPAVVEGHALVGERVEDEGGEVVVAEDLELPDRVVLELRTDLPDEVRDHQQDDVGHEGVQYVVRRDAALGHPVDDVRHRLGVQERQAVGVPEGCEDAEEKVGPVFHDRFPVIIQSSCCGVLFHSLCCSRSVDRG